jgi:hypothetical protein
LLERFLFYWKIEVMSFLDDVVVVPLMKIMNEIVIVQRIRCNN